MQVLVAALSFCLTVLTAPPVTERAAATLARDKGVDAVAEKLDVVALPPIAAADLFDKTRPLTTPPTEMAVLDLPEPSFVIDDERMASTERTAM